MVTGPSFIRWTSIIALNSPDATGILFLATDELDKAADIAENRLGMSALDSHHATHMAKFMPEGMRQAGTGMHRAASRFALKAQEGDELPAYAALADITSACVACHSGYRIR